MECFSSNDKSGPVDMNIDRMWSNLLSLTGVCAKGVDRPMVVEKGLAVAMEEVWREDSGSSNLTV